MAEAKKGQSILNVNVGVLGHVDSGKTSLGARRGGAGRARVSRAAPRRAEPRAAAPRAARPPFQPARSAR